MKINGFIEYLIPGLIAGVALVVGISLKIWGPKTKTVQDIEQVAEEIIKDETGIDIDLITKNPENK